MRRNGFTLIEVLVALVVVGVVGLGITKIMGRFMHAVGTSTTRTVATAVAQESIETIRATPDAAVVYAAMVGTYNGTTTTGFPGYPYMNRTIRAVRTTAALPRADFTTATVTVTEPTMGTPVSMTIVVAAP
jgi:type IV pilus modification protein PilV